MLLSAFSWKDFQVGDNAEEVCSFVRRFNADRIRADQFQIRHDL